jgi:hypothetical protein
VPVGSTPITCNAKDSAQKTASCGFEVQVKYVPPAPTIAATKFVAVGDSITEGFAHVCDGAAASLTEYWRHLREIRPPPVDSVARHAPGACTAGDGGSVQNVLVS